MSSSFEQPKQCHMCQSSLDQSVFYSCTNTPLCCKHYCITCIRINFSTLSSPQQFKLSSWLCYSCQSKCLCSKCMRKKSGDSILKISFAELSEGKLIKNDKKLVNDKKNGSKKTIRFNLPDQVELKQGQRQMIKQKEKEKGVQIFDVDQQSQEYVTPSFLKSMQIPQKTNQYTGRSTTQQTSLLEIFKQESMTPLDYSSQINIGNQRKSKTIIKCKKQRNFVGLKVDRIPPYLESIMKRKQIFRKFMQEHSKKSYEQLVQEENDRIQEQKRLYESGIQFQIHIPSPVMNSQIIDSSAIIQNFLTPVKVPQTPSFVPLSEPLTPIANGGKISEMLQEQLKEYQMEDDDLSIELL